MAKWTYKVSIKNQTNRPLILDSSNVPWGIAESLPPRIEPKQTQTYSVYSPSGVAYGLEFYLTLSDECPPNEKGYGTISIGVDMPFWDYKNTSGCQASGALAVDGFQQVPDGAHNFSTTLMISTKMKGN